jgi:hypothetical protein
MTFRLKWLKKSKAPDKGRAYLLNDWLLGRVLTVGRERKQKKAAKTRNSTAFGGML